MSDNQDDQEIKVIQDKMNDNQESQEIKDDLESQNKKYHEEEIKETIEEIQYDEGSQDEIKGDQEEIRTELSDINDEETVEVVKTGRKANARQTAKKDGSDGQTTGKVLAIHSVTTGNAVANVV